MKILFFGDVFGEMGMKALENYLPKLKTEYKPNMIFINGENVHKGHGISKKLYKELMSMGISVITMGNHTFRTKELFEFIEDSNIIRPINFPKSVIGNGVITLNYNDKTISVINVMGRIFMGDSMNNPFDALDEVLKQIESDYILVDVHAEATSEKLAIAHYLDGRVTAVVGTHTHVPTADNIILPKGTMYITDIGMTGSLYGILGADRTLIMNKFLTGLPGRIEEHKTGPLQLNAVLIDTDLNKIKRINIFE
jgi:metallophosphoesterase (TIGR00282 family)